MVRTKVRTPRRRAVALWTRQAGAAHAMSDIICQVTNQSDRVEIIWSSRGGFFRPYVISGQPLTELRQAANRSADGHSVAEKPSCREALEALVFTLNQAGGGTIAWGPAFE